MTSYHVHKKSKTQAADLKNTCILLKLERHGKRGESNGLHLTSVTFPPLHKLSMKMIAQCSALKLLPLSDAYAGLCSTDDVRRNRLMSYFLRAGVWCLPFARLDVYESRCVTRFEGWRQRADGSCDTCPSHCLRLTWKCHQETLSPSTDATLPWSCWLSSLRPHVFVAVKQRRQGPLELTHTSPLRTSSAVCARRFHGDAQLGDDGNVCSHVPLHH